MYQNKKSSNFNLCNSNFFVQFLKYKLLNDERKLFCRICTILLSGKTDKFLYDQSIVLLKFNCAENLFN
jgi:hypothetical protein